MGRFVLHTITILIYHTIMSDKATKNTKIAVFAGGCFWCTEAIFQSLKGVVSVMPGYCGGIKDNPTYEEVSAGSTGHVESLRVEYDPTVITYNDLLTVFFFTHNPTAINRQGNDVGEQYRSVIFFASDDDRIEAERFIRRLEESGAYDRPIATSIEPLGKFFDAEEYHRDYYSRNKNNRYCEIVIEPKLTKLRERYRELLRS